MSNVGSHMPSNMALNVLGWDIGGAHLKAVLLDAKGEVINCVQLPCPLWKGLDQLEIAMTDALVQLNFSGTLQPQELSPQKISAKADYSYVKAFKIAPYSICHAITMTGELVDLFENRHEGVCEIANLATKLLGQRTFFYTAPSSNHTGGFVPLQRVSALSANIASANWHASASALAMHAQDALLVDIGSTTTDIITIKHGKVICGGLSDAYRMQADSLVYTGVVRTPVMALAQKLPFDDGDEIVKINVAAEYFATMADVYRLTGELTQDDADTADGKGKTQLESARRLARMIGHDLNIKDMHIKNQDKHDSNKNSEKWTKLAFACRNLQMQQIKSAMLKQLKPNMTIIGAGAGSFLAKQIADDLNHNFVPAYQLASMRVSCMNNQFKLVYSAEMTLAVTGLPNNDLNVCFPAYAVAFLAQTQSIC